MGSKRRNCIFLISVAFLLSEVSWAYPGQIKRFTLTNPLSGIPKVYDIDEVKVEFLNFNDENYYSLCTYVGPEITLQLTQDSPVLKLRHVSERGSATCQSPDSYLQFYSDDGTLIFSLGEWNFGRSPAAELTRVYDPSLNEKDWIRSWISSTEFWQESIVINEYY